MTKTLIPSGHLRREALTVNAESLSNVLARGTPLEALGTSFLPYHSPQLARLPQAETQITKSLLLWEIGKQKLLFGSFELHLTESVKRSAIYKSLANHPPPPTPHIYTNLE
jgi:hypothetical protein